MGNYITLTNLKDSDVDRIIKMRISPVNISVHTMNPELRVSMMKNKRAGEVLGYLKKLADAGIELNCQIVLCNGINDGKELEHSMKELAELYPALNSVSVVPSGMTRFREKLYPLKPFTSEECASVIKQVTEFGDECVNRFGSRLFFLGDEFYLKAGIELPDEDFYEGYAQIENGVGMITSMRTEFGYAIEDIQDEHATVTRERRISCATGYAAYDCIKSMADEAMASAPELKVNVYRIKNNFFGESITVAGLLTGKDVLEQLREASEKGELGETLLLPKVMLKADEDIFLDDMTPNELSEALGVKIEFVGNDGAELLNTLIGRCENP